MVKEEGEGEEVVEGRLFQCVVKQTGGEARVKDAKRAWERHPSLSEPGSAMRSAPSGREGRQQGRGGDRGGRGARSETGTANAPFCPLT